MPPRPPSVLKAIADFEQARTRAKLVLDRVLDTLGWSTQMRVADDLGDAFGRARMSAYDPPPPDLIKPTSRRDFLLDAVALPTRGRAKEARRLRDLGNEREYTLEADNPLPDDEAYDYQFMTETPEMVQKWDARHQYLKEKAPEYKALTNIYQEATEADRPRWLERQAQNVRDTKIKAQIDLEDTLLNRPDLLELPDSLEQLAREALARALESRVQRPLARTGRIATTITDVVAPQHTMTTRDFFRQLTSPVSAAIEAINPRPPKKS